MEQEIWRKIGIANSREIYGFAEVSNIGRIKSKDGTLKKATLDQDGYHRVNFYINGFTISKYVHRLVALAFIENVYDREQVNHIDSNRINNNIENLEWVSAYGNTQHSIKYGKNNPKGESNSNSKLTEKEVDEIRKKFLTGKYKVNHLAKEYKVSWTLIKLIVTNKIWKHV